MVRDTVVYQVAPGVGPEFETALAQFNRWMQRGVAHFVETPRGPLAQSPSMSSPLDVLLSPWAIQPAVLQQLQAIYERHAAGERFDPAAFEASTGQRLENERQGYTIDNGVAVVPLVGVLAKRMNLFHAISGGASHELFARDLRMAADDPRVHAILLDIDSPGGTVDGTVAAAQAVREVRGYKPIHALANSRMMSGAYWIGCWADDVFAIDGVTQVGSIGVVCQHVDRSERNKALGVKVTDIVAGRYKRAGSPDQPLDKESRAYLQSQVDAIYEQFLATVAEARGGSPEQVHQRMADGRIFIGQQAADVRLVSGIKTHAQAVADLRSAASRKRSLRRFDAAADPTPTREVTSMSNVFTAEARALPVAALAAAIAAEHPELTAVISGPNAEAAAAKATRDAQAAQATAVEAARAEGAAAERDRIAAVRASGMPGHEALIEQLAADGKTTGPEAAVAVLGAERALRAKAAKEVLDAPAPVPGAPSATGHETSPAAQSKQVDAQQLAVRITAKVDELAKVGRHITPVQALAMLDTPAA